MLSDEQIKAKVKERFETMIRQHSVRDMMGFISGIQLDLKISQAKALNILSNLQEEYGRR